MAEWAPPDWCGWCRVAEWALPDSCRLSFAALAREYHIAYAEISQARASYAFYEANYGRANFFLPLRVSPPRLYVYLALG